MPEQAGLLEGDSGCSCELSAEWVAALAAAAEPPAERCCCCCSSASEPSAKACSSSCSRRSSGMPTLRSSWLREPPAAACVASCQALTLSSSSSATAELRTPSCCSSTRDPVLAAFCCASWAPVDGTASTAVPCHVASTAPCMGRLGAGVACAAGSTAGELSHAASTRATSSAHQHAHFGISLQGNNEWSLTGLLCAPVHPA